MVDLAQWACGVPVCDDAGAAYRMALVESVDQVPAIIQRTTENTARIQARRPSRARLPRRSVSSSPVSQLCLLLSTPRLPPRSLSDIFSSLPSCLGIPLLVLSQILRALMCSLCAFSTLYTSFFSVSVIDFIVAFHLLSDFFKTCRA